MTTRFLLLLGMLSISLGMFALFAGDRGYPLLLVVAGGIMLARLCFRPGSPPSSSSDDRHAPRFSMPPVGTCPPDRLREARDLAARVVEASNSGGAHHR
ncbi:hypothetical protein [Arthrobacter burdickii]|uniref:Uncharacterized protein n=1 Tax=Arthrobacter burdickii TaxID=3035920 RepID=A0ABT8JZH8_9MICC|nr:hypothetical protein [Arthrobacter burdickii]MDN4610580.1 hypothetical protein [Arthrobacter burdickii]